MNDNWCPLFPDNCDYLVIGERRQTGAIGIPEQFQEEVSAPSSYDAWITIHNKPGYEHVLVKAIKMKCENCDEYHLTVPTLLYLGV